MTRTTGTGSLGLALGISLLALFPAVAAAQRTTVTPPPPVVSAEEEQARSLFEQGIAHSDAGRWGEALDAFRASRALVERPSTIYNVASALHRLGRIREAITTLDELLRVADPVVDAAARDQATTLRTELAASLARLVLDVRPSVAELAVDGASHSSEGDVRELVLDPGEHALDLHAAGFQSAHVELTLAPGSREHREIVLERLPQRPATLVIAAPREDAIVLVDDVEVGRGRAQIDLAAGAHVVRVEARDHQPVRQLVDLAPAERIELHPELVPIVPRTVLEEPAFWIVAAGVLVAGGGITAGVVIATQPAAPYSGTAGFTVTALSF